MKNNEQQIAQLVETWAEAERNSDASAVAALLHDQFIGIGPLGFMLNKEQWLHRIASGELAYDALEVDETSVRHFGPSAIAITHYNQQAKFKGQAVNAELRASLVFVNQDGAWLIAGLQFSPMGQPPQFGNQPAAK